MSRFVDTSSATLVAEIFVKHWRPSDASWTKSVWSPICKTIVGKAVRRSSLGAWMGKSTELGVSVCPRKQGLFLPVYVDDIKMAGRMQNMVPMWKKLMNLVDLDEPTSFLDHENLGCTQRECNPNETIFDEQRKMFESRNFCYSSWKATRVGATSRKDGRMVLRHGRTCSKMRWNVLWTRKQKDRTVVQVSTPCLDDHNFKKEELEAVGKLSNVFSQIVLSDLTFLWSVIKTCSSSHNMDKSLWQTLGEFDLFHSSHKWLQTVLSCG